MSLDDAAPMQVGFFLLLLLLALQIHFCGAPPTSPARSLDALLQEYAYRSVDVPVTGKMYAVGSPANMSGVQVCIGRYRSGSFRSRGMGEFEGFKVPAGFRVSPFVLRMALVYHNLGNWSAVYYSLPAGYTFLTPVVGVLVYDGTDLSASNLPELDLVAPTTPISINFTWTTPAPFGARARCAHFYLNGSGGIGDPVMSPENVCTTRSQGHFAVVVSSAAAAATTTTTTTTTVPVASPSPPGVAGGKSKLEAWQVVVSPIGGLLGLVVVVVAVVLLRNQGRRKEKMADMVSRAEDGEALRSLKVGNALLPVFCAARTPPVLEDDYTP